MRNGGDRLLSLLGGVSLPEIPSTVEKVKAEALCDDHVAAVVQPFFWFCFLLGAKKRLQFSVSRGWHYQSLYM